MRASSLVRAVVMLMGTLSPAGAQQKATATLSGVVRDVAGAPIENARAQVADHRRRVQSDVEGRFAIRGLPVGDSLHLIVGRIGFRPEHLVLMLTAGDNALEVQLEPLPQHLDAVRTASEQTGVFGVVGDTSFNVIEAAKVTLTTGSGGDRETNAIGQFAFEKVQGGANFLQVQRTGFKAKLVSFFQPPKGGTRLAIWMMPATSAVDMQLPNQVVQQLFDFKARARYRTMAAAIISRDMLAKYASGMRLGDGIDAMPGSVNRSLRASRFKVLVDDVEMTDWTLNDYEADDVEMVELYPPCSDQTMSIRNSWMPGCIRGAPRSISSARGAGAGVQSQAQPAYHARVWLRR